MAVVGTLFIVSAPSGGGKTSLIDALIQRLPFLKVSISHTTRAIRAGEMEGKNYFFVDEDTFQRYQKEEVFLESATVFNYRYGTSKSQVLQSLQEGFDVILDIDWQGARRIKEKMNCVSIFILPPSREALLARLQKRKQDSNEVIGLRMERASAEISHYAEYEYIIVNDDFELALTDLQAIICAQRLKTEQQSKRHTELIASLLS